MHRFDGILQWLLEVHDIRYTVLTESDLGVRVEKVARAVAGK